VNKIIGTLTLCVLSLAAYPQQLPDTVKIREVEIAEQGYRLFSAGVNVYRPDSAVLQLNRQNTLTDLLSLHSPLTVKEYGSGSLASVSFRGTSAGHTLVSWNGFPVNSSTAGELDISLVPVSLTDNVAIAHGGAASLYSTAAMGGIIHLDNQPDWNKGSLVQGLYRHGSFSNHTFTLKALTGSSNVQSSTTLQLHQGLNNFPFRNTSLYNSPLMHQTHAATRMTGLMQSIHYRLNGSNTLYGHLWHLVNEREIPPIMTKPRNLSVQKDSILRGIIGWSNLHRNGSLHVKGAFFSEHLNYKDPEIQLNSGNEVNKYLAQAELRHYYLDQKLAISAGILFSNIHAFVDAYGKERVQNRLNLFAGANYTLGRSWKASLLLRQEFTTGYKAPPCPAAGVEGMIVKGLYVTGNYSRNFNIPTLNQQYWIPSQTSNLLPENGWNADLGMTSRFGIPKLRIRQAEIALNGYSSRVDNWIQWAPSSVQIWAPVNMKKVWSRGLEGRMNAELAYRQLSVSLRGSYAYTLSTNEEVYTAYELPGLGKQLIYIPPHKATAGASFRIRRYNLDWIVSSTGYRYLNPENDRYLDGFTLMTLQAGRSIQLGTFGALVQLRVNNLTNTQYQSVAHWVAPGRSYMLSVQLEFNNRKSNSNP
jgi:vitamin B12 transporter